MPFEFNTIGVDDGIAMGHDGMLYSLPSRELIADSIETMMNAPKLDALLCIPNCDKIDVVRTRATTVTGETMGDRIAGARIRNPEVIRPLEQAYSQVGGLAVLQWLAHLAGFRRLPRSGGRGKARNPARDIADR